MKYSHLRGSPLPTFEGITLEGEGLRRAGHPLRHTTRDREFPRGIPARVYAKETGRMILEAIVLSSFVLSGLGIALVIAERL